MIIKVCGMRNAANIKAAEEAGADWIGLIFHKDSPRFVSMYSSLAGIIPEALVKGNQVVARTATEQ